MLHGTPVLGIDVSVWSPSYILLLPHRRILILDHCLYIADFASQSPSNAPFRPQLKSKGRFGRPHPYTIPFYINHSLRLILYDLANRSLAGVIISIDPHVAVSDSMEFALLAQYNAPAAHDRTWLDYRRGVGIHRERADLLCYRRPGDSLPVPSFSEVTLPRNNCTAYIDKGHEHSRLVMFIYERPCKTAFFG
ncbi:hypothetical protein CC2G_012437 [Coprinopsis cinerea AmutBmut pab1-1]|nr:hypothetical protein CC2G_012437 [Coprinopsis cinerea AmutBmut pab1-1]